MPSHASSNSPTPTPHAGTLVHTLARILAAWGLEIGAAMPVRVYYKFESGGWRSRSTRQLQKVYRCK